MAGDLQGVRDGGVRVPRQRGESGGESKCQDEMVSLAAVEQITQNSLGRCEVSDSQRGCFWGSKEQHRVREKNSTF